MRLPWVRLLVLLKLSTSAMRIKYAELMNRLCLVLASVDEESNRLWGCEVRGYSSVDGWGTPGGIFWYLQFCFARNPSVDWTGREQVCVSPV